MMRSQSGTPTSASVLEAFRAAKDIPMEGIIRPWTPAAYQSPGNLGVIFANLSNPWIYRISYGGRSTSTTPADVFNTFLGLPGSRASSRPPSTQG
jgi:hypothetical protein